MVRVTTNTPLLVGEGMSVISGGSFASAEQLRTAEEMLIPVGQVVRLPEYQQDAATALAGSGPAYVFLLVEALARAGEAEGLSPPLALKLARATIVGAGALLESDKRSATELRQAVTSPGGTTEAALAVLMENEALAVLMARAVAAARARAQALSS